MTQQQDLFSVPVEVPEGRVRALAGVMAGFRWPERTSFEALKQKQREAALAAARQALVTLALEAD